MDDKPITTIKYLCEFYGISQTELARKYDIPLRTVQQWHAGHRTPPPYVVNMIVELLHREHCEKEREKESVYFIYSDSLDDACTMLGYCTSEEDADKYCEEHGGEYWEGLDWLVLDKL